MPTSSALLTFAAATLLLLLVPGPSVLYLVARSLHEGRTAGLISMLGVETGALVHVALTAGGLGTVLAASPWALTAIKYAGAAYLLVMGIRQLLSSRPAIATETTAGGTHGTPWTKLFRDGVLVDLLNPKTTLFFLAFLPQFVDPGRGPAATQLLTLGLCFVLLAVVTDGGYALAAGTIRSRLQTSTPSRRWAGRLTAGVYLGLGGLTVLA